MKKNFKKIIVFVITIAFLSMALPSTINAENTKKTSFKATVEEDTSIYDLLIITPKNFAKTLQPLVCHKNHMGMKTKLTTLNEVYKQTYWQGRDCAEKIKYYIKNAYDNWGISYVMLVGNFRKMPIRYVYNDEPGWDMEPKFISELYYADIYDENGSFSSWDTNNNGIYGEWIGNESQDKNIDLYPDVYVGRLPCRNKFEVKIMVHKIITYETETYDKDWFNKIIVCAGDTYPECKNSNWTAIEGEENAKEVLSYMPGFENTTLFTSDGSFKGPVDIIKAINKGCGFLYFEGHANPTSWCTHPPNSTAWINGLSLANMPFLWNMKKLPVCVVGGCHNNQFDVNMLNFFTEGFLKSIDYGIGTPECWGWKLTRKIGGGSIATLGCTGLGMTKEDKESFSGAGDFLEPHFFYEYGINGTEHLGECWGNAITSYLNEYPIDWDTPAGWDYAIDAKTVQQWVVFGDPSLKLGGYEIN